MDLFERYKVFKKAIEDERQPMTSNRMNVEKTLLENAFLRDITPKNEITRNKSLIIIKKIAKYEPFFAPSPGNEGEIGPLSDHIPLIYQNVLSYNTLCPGSPNGLGDNENHPIIESRDYEYPNRRAIKNFSLINKWVSLKGIAIVQEVSLAFKDHFAYKMGEEIGGHYERTFGNKFYQATFFNLHVYKREVELEKRFKECLAGFDYSYRSQTGRILITCLFPLSIDQKNKALIVLNVHLLPGGRNPKSQKNFVTFIQNLLQKICCIPSIKFLEKIILAGDLNNEPSVLEDIILPQGWYGKLIYAPSSSQSWWKTGPHLITNDAIIILSRQPLKEEEGGC